MYNYNFLPLYYLRDVELLIVNLNIIGKSELISLKLTTDY